jgi:formylglycine-generating enzyme required for sulfatase activity
MASIPTRTQLVTGTAAALAVALVAASAPASQRVQRRQLERALKHESEMVLVPAGPFVMGAEQAELADFQRACEVEFGDELAPYVCVPERTKDFDTGGAPRVVFLSAFEIDRTEVTTAQYRECVARGPCDMRPLVAGDARYAVDAWPMVNVTWDDAATYCAWRGKRLPSEAEWEKAARGDDGRRYPWGNFDRAAGGNTGRVEPEVERPPQVQGIGFSIDESDGFRELAPPGSLPFGRSPYGALDMAGNAAEWVADWYDENGYAAQSTVDPAGPKSGHLKVTRGGSFFEPRFFARTYYRNAELPTERSITRGMRCAR